MYLLYSAPQTHTTVREAQKTKIESTVQTGSGAPSRQAARYVREPAAELWLRGARCTSHAPCVTLHMLESGSVSLDATSLFAQP